MLRYVLCAPGFFRTFILRVCWPLSNAFLCLLRWSCNFYLYIYYYVLVHVLLWVCWTNLASLEKINLVVGYDLLNVILNLVCEYYVWDLRLYLSVGLVGKYFLLFLCDYLVLHTRVTVILSNKFGVFFHILFCGTIWETLVLESPSVFGKRYFWNPWLTL